MKTALVDANVILRFITRSPREMAEAARNLFKQAEAGEIGLIILTITVAEVVWVWIVPRLPQNPRSGNYSVRFSVATASKWSRLTLSRRH